MEQNHLLKSPARVTTLLLIYVVAGAGMYIAAARLNVDPKVTSILGFALLLTAIFISTSSFSKHGMPVPIWHLIISSALLMTWYITAVIG